ncbi:MAG: hypothetical protein RJA22_2595 [Verrucomicrobiota bacterium]
MILRLVLRVPALSTLLCLAGVFWLEATAASRWVRLRNETIDTQAGAPVTGTAAGTGTAAATVTGVVTGLYVVQFRDRVQPAWREAMAARRVDLLSYVPDDAFVARLEGVSVEELRALPFVQWVGAYRPEHKIYRGLLAPGVAAGEVAVTVLVAPRAPAVEAWAVRRRMRSVEQESRLGLGTVLRGRVAAGGVTALAESSAVLWIEPAPRMRLRDQVASEIVAGEGVGQSTLMQEAGLTGLGVTVAVADSGLHTGTAAGMHPDLLGRVLAFFYYGLNLTDASDEHSHGTHVAGIIAGNGSTGEVDETGALYGLGVAPEAWIIAQRIFDGVGNYEPPPSFEVLTHDAVRAGADIGSNSWGDDTQGRYDVSAAEFDELVRDADAGVAGDQPYILEFSAGNAGPGAGTIGTPAVGKNVIASGAAQNNRFDFFIYEEGQEAMADFSSRGPAEDGRIKPDVVAPGTWIASLRSGYADDNNAWAEISQNYIYQGGTSQSGPHVSGAAAVFVQHYRESHGGVRPSPALVKAALIHSAVDMDDTFGTVAAPNNDEGWGRVDLPELLLSGRPLEMVDQAVRLTVGQVHERQLVLASGEEPLKVTLAYTDVPGFPAVLPALVNDLDLEVIGPDGRVYRGNQFDVAGESVPDVLGVDALNNVEGVLVWEPLPGEYRVRVVARNVAQDAVRATPAVDQDFALVLSGAIPAAGAGTLFLDRPAYRAPGQVRLRLIDADVTGVATQSVTVASTTEPAGLPVVLRATGTPGSFTGAVATALGPAGADGVLQLAQGDVITARYYDVSFALWREATAVVDLVPPVMTGVTVTNRFGETVVAFATDEPAFGVVRYGTNATLNRVSSNAVAAVWHEVAFTNLVVGRTYQFRVEATDLAGNLATLGSGSTNFTFVAPPTATVLLVNNYIDQTEAEFIPLSAYTDALGQLGVTYDVWNATTAGATLPALASLRPYRVVIWRVNDASIAGSTESIPLAQQSALTQYLAGGGSFFMASMEILSRLGPVAFRTNVLRVQQFSTNPDPFNPCFTCDEDVGVSEVEGEAQDPISSGMLATLDYTRYPDFFGLLGPDLSDTFIPATNAAPILFSAASGKACGIRYPRTGQDSTGRVVFCSFPLDALPETGEGPNTRAGFLRNVLQFLVPGLDGFGTIALSQADYGLPDLVVVEVADGDLVEGPLPVVQFRSDSVPAPVAVTLQETAQPGLFRGYARLAPLTSAPGPGVLRAAHGNRIYADYLDASGAKTVTAEALVDAVAPVITGLGVDPSYDAAVFVWDTDEPTDALVQYGESELLGRTAYVPDLDFQHEVVLAGLEPDRTYYYQVVSRDSAGNARVDDNGGQLYTFRTLKPLVPPYVELFEGGLGNWQVFNGEDTTSEWTLGVPANGIEDEAWSPVNCWGSSRLGAMSDLIDTFLISPAIDLTGGNSARLRFRHQWDFTEQTPFDLLEFGQVLIFTNSLTEPVVLSFYEEFSLGWEEADLDLTPYAGRVITLVWHHQLLAFEAAPRPGWLLDDVEVTLSSIAPATVRITNNLAQARWTLTGPVSRSGQGLDTVITNAGPGSYTVTWSAVPHYTAPAPQTLSVAAGGSLVLGGLYTFADANANGMADTWEQQFWGALDPGRGPGFDSDLDGASDYAEFMAGTDPTSEASFLGLGSEPAVDNGSLRLQWASVPGRAYQVQASADLAQWVARTAWLTATGAVTSVSVPLPGPGQPHLFRIEVRP